MKVFAIFALAAASAVFAVAAPVDVPASELTDPSVVPVLPTVKTANGIDYMNGGAGAESVTYLKNRSAEFPLQIIFSGRGGEYGVAEKVSILSAEREVFTVPNAGPILMVKLPRGTYSVEATFKGVAEKRKVSIGSGVSKIEWSTSRASD